MEDYVRNEFLENGKIHTVFRSGTCRSITRQENVDLLKSKLRQINVREQQLFMSLTQSNTTHKDCDVISDKHHIRNGVPNYKNVESDNWLVNISPILGGGPNSNNLSNHGSVDQHCIHQSSTPKSAFLFYKAAGDWWNVFPKTDYTYSKSSSYRKEVAPGVMNMPNMSRPPLRTYLSRSVESSARSLNRAINKSNSDYTDKTYVVSSSKYTHSFSTRTSLLTKIITTIWYIFSSAWSILTLRKVRLAFESTQVSRRRHGIMVKSLYHRLEVMCYQSACYFLLLDAWILSLFHRSYHGNQLVDKKRHSKSLLLLLIPPLLFIGLWWSSASTPVAVLSSFMSGIMKLLPSLLVQKTSTYDMVKHANFILEDGNMDLLVQNILSSSEFKSILLMHDFRNKEQQLQNEERILSITKLERERLNLKIDHENQDLNLALTEQKKILMEQQVTNEHLTLEYSALRDSLEQLKIQIKSLQAYSLLISRRVGACRKVVIQTVPKIEIEHHVTSFLSGLFETSDKGESNNLENLKIWIKTLLMAKDNLEEHLAGTMTVVNERIKEATEKSANIVMASISEMIKQEFLKQEAKFRADGAKYVSVTDERVTGDACDGCSLSIDQVTKIVNNALLLYDADKTGMVDYALESAGGTVINIRCTENYNERSLALSFLGMTFPWSSNHPRIALQPEVHPGRCWAFRGAQGYLVIRLAKRIKVSAFSIEHIPVSISHTGNINAAPKNFSVWGLDTETDREPVLLGKYIYETTGLPLQMFPVQNENASSYQIVELAIESNHGNLEYTCLYRFRVHGLVV